ncbi:hypothetical protein D1BOALGB6SA_7905 [Olavius sp. associated proteobacterium Delta 1]|nr:hypothetical protein D1BOALGB6SA_7905 [Olavius sp. associated proteobacterium Delta 1]
MKIENLWMSLRLDVPTFRSSQKNIEKANNEYRSKVFYRFILI